MKNKLYIVEGSTASGKDTLLNELQKRGFATMRGIPSQYPEQNIDLTGETRKVIQNTEFNFKEMIQMPTNDLESLLGKYISGARYQHEYAKDIKQDKTAFMNRSFISIAAHLRMLLQLRNPGSEKILEQLLSDVINSIQSFLPSVDGIIHMSVPILGVKTSSVQGFEQQEADEISSLIEELQLGEQFILRLDATKISIEEELKRVLEFSQ